MRGRSAGGMEHVPRRAPIARDELHGLLRAWHADAMDDEVIRDPGVDDEDAYDGDDWVWVKHLGNRYYLHAGTNYEGVGRYLQLLDAAGDSIRWHCPPGAGDRPVAIGADGEMIEGFRLFRAP
ncbi:MAG TPA: hypothetical protein VF613_07005 [Longimicrobium sp.]